MYVVQICKHKCSENTGKMERIRSKQFQEIYTNISEEEKDAIILVLLISEYGIWLYFSSLPKESKIIKKIIYNKTA